MAAAALTPRVRLATVCDRARESRTEPGVYHLRGVRQRIVVPTFPFAPSRLWLFLVLSSPRTGAYPGSVRVIDEATDKAVYFAQLAPHPHQAKLKARGAKGVGALTAPGTPPPARSAPSPRPRERRGVSPPGRVKNRRAAAAPLAGRTRFDICTFVPYS